MSTDARLSFFHEGKFGTKTAIEIGRMTRKIAPLAAIAFLVFGCSRSGKMQRNQQDYQTVQEGSASGVTSTINAPGETTTPLTNTNVDTTTNFTLPTNPAPLGNDTAGGSMASSMPAYPVGSPGLAPTPRPRTRAPGEQRPPTDTAATDTMSTTPPPIDTRMTDTSSTDTKKKKDDGKKNDSDQPPPPPPPTDTQG